MHTHTHWTQIHLLFQTAKFPEGILGIPGTVFLIPKSLVLGSSCLDLWPRSTLAYTHSPTFSDIPDIHSDELKLRCDWATGNSVILAVPNHEWWIPLAMLSWQALAGIPQNIRSVFGRSERERKTERGKDKLIKDCISSTSNKCFRDERWAFTTAPLTLTLPVHFRSTGCQGNFSTVRVKWGSTLYCV